MSWLRKCLEPLAFWLWLTMIGVLLVAMELEAWLTGRPVLDREQ